MSLREVDPQPGDVLTIHRTVTVKKIDDRGALWTEDGICYGLDKEYFSADVLMRAPVPENPDHWPPMVYDVWRCGSGYYSAHIDSRDRVYLLTTYASVRYYPDDFLTDIGIPELVFRAGLSLSLAKQEHLVIVNESTMTVDQENKRLHKRCKDLERSINMLRIC